MKKFIAAYNDAMIALMTENADYNSFCKNSPKTKR